MAKMNDGVTFRGFGNTPGALGVAVIDGALLFRIAIDAKTIKEAGLSKSAKSRLVANTGGWIPVTDVPGGLKVSLMVSAPKD